MCHDLITISPPDKILDANLLDHPGSFLWWYMDMINDEGDGVVLIWSWGIPFLPGIASSVRQGSPIAPRERPSLTLAVYKGFELDCYTFQEYDPHEATWEIKPHRGDDNAQAWRFGQNRCRMWRAANAQTGEPRVQLEIDIHERIPGSLHPLVGQITLDGVARRPRPSVAHGVTNKESDHDWTPLCGPAQGRVELFHGATHYDIEGRAYHDRNSGRHALHELGFRYWIWGRVPCDDREVIYYILWPTQGSEPTCVAMEILSDGRTRIYEDTSLRLSGTRRELPGMTWYERVEIFLGGERWCEVRVRSIIDNGPFYLRFFIEASTPRGEFIGFGEACEPERVDLAKHRPLVQMRVGQPAKDSIWRPLFTGPRQGRTWRLLTQFLPGNAR